MNANSLWAGQDYAYYEDRGRGNPLPMNARRVRVQMVLKRRDYVAERSTTYAQVFFIDQVSEEPITGLREVKARDIIMRWDEYVNERDAIKADDERKNREREARFQKDKERVERIRTAFMEKFGIKPYAVNTHSISLLTKDVEEVLFGNEG